MIDPAVESLLTLREVAKLPQLCRNGRSPHLASVHRWVGRGLRGIPLESIVVAGARCSTAEAVDRWIAALTDAANGAKATAQTSFRRQRDHERASAELEKAGW